MLRTGVDIVEIARIEKSIQRHGKRFLKRIYTEGELNYCQERLESLAGRFAAKEAAAKALGTGIWRAGIEWTDIEVKRDPESGAPQLILHQAAKEQATQLKLTEWSISISHDSRQAIAFVVAMG